MSADGKCSFIDEHFLPVLAGEKLQDDADTFYCRTYELVKKREKRMERVRDRMRAGKSEREIERQSKRKRERERPAAITTSRLPTKSGR